MKTVLMVAYHYPPEGSSSGVHRTLTFSRYLRDFGWEPIVLTASARAYTLSRSDQLDDIPEGMMVRRAFALDSSRHLAVAGRYPRFVALPDRWVSWWFGGVASGWRLARKFRPCAIWSTYPIATAHLIGHSLQKLTGLPWIADFRDSMTEHGYPTDARQWRAYRRVEQRTMSASSRCVFTASGAVRMYQERYANLDATRFAVIPNGFDEASFAEAENRLASPPRGKQVVLLHSGVLYPSERDPSAFYRALARLLRDKLVDPETLRIVFRSTGHDAHHHKLIETHGLEELITLAPRLAYRDALREMLQVDGLLIFQASSCNHQVPAKIYEYLRARKPILALTDPIGDTAQVLRAASLEAIVPLDNEELIAKGILNFLAELRAGNARIVSDAHIATHSRRARTEALARLFDEVCAETAS